VTGIGARKVGMMQMCSLTTSGVSGVGYVFYVDMCFKAGGILMERRERCRDGGSDVVFKPVSWERV